MIKKYANRFGSNQREGQEKLDFIKIAHYAQCACDKIDAGDRIGNKEVFLGEPTVAIDELEDFLDSKKLWNKNVKITIELVD